MLRCIAPRKRQRQPGERCNGFVALVARPVRVLGVVVRSELAPAGADVVGCTRCGALHALAPEAQRALVPP